jgi:hypothetical protein
MCKECLKPLRPLINAQKKSNKKVNTCEKKSQYLGADYMDRASPVNRAEKCHENLPWAAK